MVPPGWRGPLRCLPGCAHEQLRRATRAASGVLDRYFKITERGSTVAREIRGGVVTFFTMAYIVVLNPLIIGFAPDVDGNFLGGGDEPNLAAIAAGTALVAGVMTILMGVIANYPLAMAAGLGLNAFVAFAIASQMTWADAMGLVVIEGLVILLLVLTGFRTAVFHAIPPSSRPRSASASACSSRSSGSSTPASSGASRTPPAPPCLSSSASAGSCSGWPLAGVRVGLLLLIALWVRKVKGAILISILATTVVAIIVEAVPTPGPSIVRHGEPRGWRLNVPTLPTDAVEPDFGSLGTSTCSGLRRIGGSPPS